MATIEVDNSFCKLTGFSDTSLKLAEKALTYKDDSITREKEALWFALKKASAKKQFKYVAILKKRIEEIGPDKVCLLKDGAFPTGLLNVVARAVGLNSFTVKDIRKVPEGFNLFRWNNVPKELRYYQNEAVAAFLENHRGVLEMSVGSGKTRCAVEIIKELGVNTLFVVPSSALLTQAHDVFVNAFGDKNVQIITTADIKKAKKLKPIRVITVQTLASLNKNKIADQLLGDIDLLILDEVHHGGAKSYTELLPLFKNIYYRLGLSGTYLRNDAKTLDLWGLAGDVLYSYSAAKATKEGFLTPVEFNIVKLKGKIYNSYPKEYKENYGSIEFLRAIETLITRVIARDAQILILIDRKDACGNLIYAYLKEQGITISYVTGDNSKNEIREAIEDFNDKKIRILIGSTIFSEGCDIVSTDALIMGRGGKSEIAFTQAVGRCVRLYKGKKLANVYDFDFMYAKYLHRHTKLRIKTYEKAFEGKINMIDLANRMK